MKRTDKLRELMSNLQTLETEHNRQRNCPSLGYSEDNAFRKMEVIQQNIEAELDRLDKD